MSEIRVLYPCSITRSPKLQWVGPDDNTAILNVGAGINPIFGPGVVNADVEPGENIQSVFDCRQTWPFPDHTFTKVVSFHALEHILPDQALHFCKEAKRVLQPGGLFILETPNMLGLAKDLLEGNLGAIRTIYAGGLGSHNDTPGMAHRWGWDASSLWLLVTLAGFYQGVTSRGTDYHAPQMETVRVEAVA